MFIFLDIKNTQISFRDLEKITLPSKAKNPNHTIPRNNYWMQGLFTYEGNFTGFINDFVSYGKTQE